MSSLVERIKARFDALQPVLDERSRRLWAGAEALAIGRGAIARVSSATGLSRDTVRAGLKQVRDGEFRPARAPGDRLRRPGGGRKSLVERDPELLAALERKLDPVTRGDPMSPLRWTCLSAAKLAEALSAEGHSLADRFLADLVDWPAAFAPGAAVLSRLTRGQLQAIAASHLLPEDADLAELETLKKDEMVTAVAGAFARHRKRSGRSPWIPSAVFG